MQLRVVGHLSEKLLAAARCLDRGSRAEHQPDHEPLHDLTLLETVTGAPGVRKRALGNLDGEARSPVEIVRL